ncbi:hypothetical protein GCM10028805_55590 [Spirosoma harenae]
MRKLFIVLFFGIINLAHAQYYSSIQPGNYFNGALSVKKKNYSGTNYILFDFNRDGNVMKAKYFARNANTQFTNWRRGKEILLVTAGAFSDSFLPSGLPVGLCVDNGTIVTRTPDDTMDGMVIVYNGGAQEGGVAVVDMDVKPVTADKASYYPRTNASDRVNFLNWGQQKGLTLFQTQLVYSSDRSSNFNNMSFGSRRERRFLAICKKGNVVHHVIVDAPDPLELNVSASNTKSVLESEGFSVSYIMNLDTGDKNILHAYSGAYLKDYKPNSNAKIEDATNLIIYYK